MPIPDFQSIMKPLLEYAAGQEVVAMSDAIDALGKHFKLSEQELAQQNSGGTPTFRNRVHWARQYLVFARLVEPQGRGYIKITPLGREWSAKKVVGFKIPDFRVIPGFVERVQPKRQENGKATRAPEKIETRMTPREEIDAAIEQMQQSLIVNLLDRIHGESPRFFELLVIDVIQSMGYGAGILDSAHHTGKAGDGGIDGFINMDHLGLERVYLQAKRYGPDGKAITREQVAAFAGSIPGDKGIFVTTAKFTDGAREFVKQTQKRIILIDGEDLCRHMLKTKRGVRVVRTYELFEIDEDYFIDEA